MKRVLAVMISVLVVVLIVTGVAWGTKPEAQAVPDDLGACLPPLVCVTVSVPVPVTVRATVTVTNILRPPPVVQTIIQRRTVTLPPLTRTVQLPGRTVTVQQPGLSGATKTATVVVSKVVTSNGTAPPVTREVRSTLSGSGATIGQTQTVGATVTPSKEVVREPGKTKTVFKAVGISLLALLALMGLGLLLLWGGFILGYRSADKENTNFLRALRDTVRRPGKHEIGS